MDGMGTEWVVGAVVAAPALAVAGKAAVTLWKIGHSVGRIEYQLKNGVATKLEQVCEQTTKLESRMQNVEVGIAVLRARCPYCPDKEKVQHERDD
jgi:hypothetical protein